MITLSTFFYDDISTDLTLKFWGTENPRPRKPSPGMFKFSAKQTSVLQEKKSQLL